MSELLRLKAEKEFRERFKEFLKDEAEEMKKYQSKTGKFDRETLVKWVNKYAKKFRDEWELKRGKLNGRSSKSNQRIKTFAKG